jgi:hypothetical protein
MDNFWPVFDLGLLHPDDVSNDEDDLLSDPNITLDVLKLDAPERLAWFKARVEERYAEHDNTNAQKYRFLAFAAAREAGEDFVSFAYPDGGSDCNEYVAGRWEGFYSMPPHKPSAPSVEKMRALAAEATDIADRIESGDVPYGHGTVATFEQHSKEAVAAWRRAIKSALAR